MPVDETNLNLKVNSLESLLIDEQDKIARIRHTLESLHSIQQQNGANPKDDRTGQLMSDATRQEIYNACIPVADEFLPSNEDEN